MSVQEAPQPNGVTDEPDPAQAKDAEACIRQALERKGFTHSSQATELAALLKITAKQVRRKLRYGIWSLQELLLIQKHYDTSLSGVLAGGVAQADSALELGSLLINGKTIECEVRVGPAMTGGTGEGLACSRVGNGWLVSTFASLDEAAPGTLRYAVEVLQVLDSGSPLRIAVLDDDQGACSSLAAWFSHSGYPAQAFTTSESLERTGIDHFDVFVVDVILSSGQTCYNFLGAIREVDPDAVIVLLTGKLRGNEPLEKELAAIIRDRRVEFYEKPTRPQILLAGILNAIARRSASSGRTV